MKKSSFIFRNLGDNMNKQLLILLLLLLSSLSCRKDKDQEAPSITVDNPIVGSNFITPFNLRVKGRMLDNNRISKYSIQIKDPNATVVHQLERFPDKSVVYFDHYFNFSTSGYLPGNYSLLLIAEDGTQSTIKNVPFSIDLAPRFLKALYVTSTSSGQSRVSILDANSFQSVLFPLKLASRIVINSLTQQLAVLTPSDTLFQVFDVSAQPFSQYNVTHNSGSTPYFYHCSFVNNSLFLSRNNSNTQVYSTNGSLNSTLNQSPNHVVKHIVYSDGNYYFITYSLLNLQEKLVIYNAFNFTMELSIPLSFKTQFLSLSNNGQLLLFANENNQSVLYRFDSQTGQLSSAIALTNLPMNSCCKLDNTHWLFATGIGLYLYDDDDQSCTLWQTINSIKSLKYDEVNQTVYGLADLSLHAFAYSGGMNLGQVFSSDTLVDFDLLYSR